MMACTTDRTSLADGQKLRLNVGDIQEVTINTRADTTWQLAATSDNQEVVDVSRKQTMTSTGSGSASVQARRAVFLIKGVTAGTARVVFTEKQAGANGDGQLKKTYVVTVTSK
ncbi:hypothetical protein J2I46_10485 [Fibrella sp. HMF5405]|uniref:Proteinase inhibitor I42 chagasin domain-containing protein n=2 Tax=Fibrella forsythiae TaxID=2817061 RepID=A0ABS3JG76_9BACT|nr:hypothetical protein [Fibrella forsythiae]